jgi:hypothetical protein
VERFTALLLFSRFGDAPGRQAGSNSPALRTRLAELSPRAVERLGELLDSEDERIQLEAAKFGLTKDDFIYAMLYEKGIKVGTHYTPLHYATAFQKRGFRQGQFPVAEGVADRMVTLPLNPRQSPEALDYLIESIRSLQRG